MLPSFYGFVSKPMTEPPELSATVTIDNSGNANDLTQYAVKVELTSLNFDFTGVEADGSDLRVLDSDGLTVIPYYIRSINVGSQVAEIWTRVDSIPGSGTKTIYISKGNSTSPFTIPPTGKFARPTSSVATGLVENMVFDSDTNKYYVTVTVSAATGPIKLYSSSSPTGPWTDEGVILNLGTAGQWDDFTVYGPHLVKDGSTWYLFYSGGGDNTDNNHAIGYATASSITGPYTRYASNPVVSYSGVADWERYRACEPYVFYSNILGLWIMIYMGDSGSGSTQVEKVGYATASAITGPWTKYGSNPIVSGVTTPDWKFFDVVADPFVIEINDTAYVFLSAGDNNYVASIGVYKTTDYVTFTEIGQVFGTGPAGRFDSTAAFRGGILKVGDTWYLPYTGKDGTNYTWAIASMSALSTASGFDPLQVFDYFDDFPGVSLDADLWTSPTGSTSGSVSVSGGVATLSITSGTNVHRTLAGHREFGVGYMIEAYIRQSTATSGGTNAGEIGLADEEDRLPTSRLYQYNTAFVIKENVSNAGASSASNMSQALSTGWQTWSVAFISSSSMGFRVDANAWETIGTNVPDRVLKPWLFAFRGSANISLEVDWVIVRKYADPEPSISVS